MLRAPGAALLSRRAAARPIVRMTARYLLPVGAVGTTSVGATAHRPTATALGPGDGVGTVAVATVAAGTTLCRGFRRNCVGVATSASVAGNRLCRWRPREAKPVEDAPED